MAQGCNLLLTREDAERLGLPKRPPDELRNLDVQQLIGKEAAESVEQRTRQLLGWAVEQLTPGRTAGRTTHEVRKALLAVRTASRVIVAEEMERVLLRHIVFNIYAPKGVDPLRTSSKTQLAARPLTFQEVTGQAVKVEKGQPVALTVKARTPRLLEAELWKSLASFQHEIKTTRLAPQHEANPPVRLMVVSEDFFAIPEASREEFVHKYTETGVSIVVGLPRYDEINAGSWAGLWPTAYGTRFMASHSQSVIEPDDEDDGVDGV